jgi:hypothetical protein
MSGLREGINNIKRMLGATGRKTGSSAGAGLGDFAVDGVEGIGRKASMMGKWMGNNLREDAGGGWGAVAKKAGMSAFKGGIVGGLAGGTMSAAQGGDFWSGAKEGAWNTGMAYGAYRTAGRAMGASTRNPLSNSGPFKSGRNMWHSMSMDDGVSKPASALLNQKQRAAYARTTMNT